MKIIRGNYVELVFGPCKDKDNATITDLDDAVDIIFQLKEAKDDAEAVVDVDLASGNITVNDPSSGYITVVLESGDTDIDSAKYYAGLEIQYERGNIEVDLRENGTRLYMIEIENDTVKSTT